MYINEVEDLVYVTAIENKIPLMLWGDVGLGKSALIWQICQACDKDRKKYPTGFGFIDVRLSQFDPTDMRGLPFPNADKTRVDWLMPGFLPDSSGKFPEHGILFLDELPLAATSTKNASLELVLDRRLGDYKLPDGWAIIAAGNPEESGTFSQPLGAALENRMTHVEVEINADVWLKWAKENDIMEDIIAFVSWKPDLLHVRRKDDEGNIVGSIATKAFPTPRTWHMGSTLMKSIKNVNGQYKLLETAIGPHAAGEYKRWNKLYRSISAEDIIHKGKIPKGLAEDEPSVKYAVTLSCAFYVNKINIMKLPAERRNTAKFLDVIPDDLAVVFWRNLKSKHALKMAKAPEFDKIVDSIMEAVEGPSK